MNTSVSESPISSPIKLPFSINDIPINANMDRVNMNGLLLPSGLWHLSLSKPKIGCNKNPNSGLKK